MSTNEKPKIIWVSGIDFNTYTMGAEQIVTGFITTHNPNRKEAAGFVPYTDYQSTLTKLNEALEKIKELETKYNGLGADYEKVYEDYTSILNCGADRHLKSKLTETQAKLDEANEKLTDLRVDYSGICTSSAILSNRLESEIAALTNTILKGSKELDKKDAEIARLTEEKAELVKHLDMMILSSQGLSFYSRAPDTVGAYTTFELRQKITKMYDRQCAAEEYLWTLEKESK